MKKLLSILILSVILLSGCSDKKSDGDKSAPEMPKDNIPGKPPAPPPPPPPPKDNK